MMVTMAIYMSAAFAQDSLTRDDCPQEPYYGQNGYGVGLRSTIVSPNDFEAVVSYWHAGSGGQFEAPTFGGSGSVGMGLSAARALPGSTRGRFNGVVVDGDAALMEAGFGVEIFSTTVFGFSGEFSSRVGVGLDFSPLSRSAKFPERSHSLHIRVGLGGERRGDRGLVFGTAEFGIRIGRALVVHDQDRWPEGCGP